MSITVNNANSVKTSQPLNFGENHEKKGMTLLGSVGTVGTGAGIGYIASAMIGVNKDKLTDAVKKRVNEFGDTFETTAVNVMNAETEEAKRTLISNLSAGEKKFAGIDDNTKPGDFVGKLQEAGAKAVKAGMTDENLNEAIESANKEVEKNEKNLETKNNDLKAISNECDQRIAAEEAEKAAKKSLSEAEYMRDRKVAAKNAKNVPTIDEAVEIAMKNKKEELGKLPGDKKIFAEIASDAKKGLKNGRNLKMAGGLGVASFIAYAGYKHFTNKN